MYLAYSMRRLDTRRQLLLENLFTLFLDDDYMRIRHGRSYHAWKEIPSSEERKKKFELDYFNKDFQGTKRSPGFFPTRSADDRFERCRMVFCAEPCGYCPVLFVGGVCHDENRIAAYAKLVEIVEEDIQSRLEKAVKSAKVTWKKSNK